MGRNGADALCEECGKSFYWLIGNPLVCYSCRTGKKKEENTEQIGFVGGKWMCLQCFLTFCWNNHQTQATYIIGSVTKSQQVGGRTKPEECPECGCREIDSLAI